ncbi:MAG TPA: hypothetical protein VIC26_12755 [Marinagarivorans sp.]
MKRSELPVKRVSIFVSVFALVLLASSIMARHSTALSLKTGSQVHAVNVLCDDILSCANIRYGNSAKPTPNPSQLSRYTSHSERITEYLFDGKESKFVWA